MTDQLVHQWTRGDGLPPGPGPTFDLPEPGLESDLQFTLDRLVNQKPAVTERVRKNDHAGNPCWVEVEPASFDVVNVKLADGVFDSREPDSAFRIRYHTGKGFTRLHQLEPKGD